MIRTHSRTKRQPSPIKLDRSQFSLVQWVCGSSSVFLLFRKVIFCEEILRVTCKYSIKFNTKTVTKTPTKQQKWHYQRPTQSMDPFSESWELLRLSFSVVSEIIYIPSLPIFSRWRTGPFIIFMIRRRHHRLSATILVLYIFFALQNISCTAY